MAKRPVYITPLERTGDGKAVRLRQLVTDEAGSTFPVYCKPCGLDGIRDAFPDLREGISDPDRNVVNLNCWQGLAFKTSDLVEIWAAYGDARPASGMSEAGKRAAMLSGVAYDRGDGTLGITYGGRMFLDMVLERIHRAGFSVLEASADLEVYRGRSRNDPDAQLGPGAFALVSPDQCATVAP